MQSESALLRALTDASEVESTTEATERVLRGLVSTLDASAGRILFLDLGTGRYTVRASVGHPTRAVPDVPAYGHSSEGATAPNDLLDVAARSRRTAVWHAQRRSPPSIHQLPTSRFRGVWPVSRGKSVVALVDIEGLREFDLGSLDALRSLAFAMIARLHERRFTVRLLNELQQPIAVEQNRGEFYDDVARLIQAASGLQMVAVRQYDGDGRLACVASNGLGIERGDLHSLDLEPISSYPSFERALQGLTTPESSLDADHLDSIRRHPIMREVRSFVVVPMIVASEVVGVLSVAARCPYEFSRVEILGFEAIANASGIAMENFKNRNISSEDVRRLATIGANTLGDLLAQSARHEAKRHLDNAQKRLNLTLRALSGKPTRIVSPAEEIQTISLALKTARESLDKMKTNSLVNADQAPVRRDLKSLLSSAQAQILGQLEELDVSLGLPDKGSYVQVIPEAVSLAFLYLLENSLNAFDSTKSKKGNRRIDIRTRPRQTGEEFLTVVYSDNATGIDPRRLTIPPELRRMPWQQALFERGVSGSGGTGFGLYITRVLLEQAGGGSKGSIELLEHTGGRVVFEIRLPVGD